MKHGINVAMHSSLRQSMSCVSQMKDTESYNFVYEKYSRLNLKFSFNVVMYCVKIVFLQMSQFATIDVQCELLVPLSFCCCCCCFFKYKTVSDSNTGTSRQPENMKLDKINAKTKWKSGNHFEINLRLFTQ